MVPMGQGMGQGTAKPQPEDFGMTPSSAAPQEITEDGQSYTGSPEASGLLKRLREREPVTPSEQARFNQEGGRPEGAGFQLKGRIKGPGEEFYEPVAKGSLRALGGISMLPFGPGAMIAGGAGAGALVGAADEAAQGAQGVREPGGPTNYLKQAGIGALEGGAEMATGIGMGAARNAAVKGLAKYGAGKVAQFGGGLAAESVVGALPRVPGVVRGEESSLEALKGGAATALLGRAVEAPTAQAAHGISQRLGRAPITTGIRSGPNLPEEGGRARQFMRGIKDTLPEDIGALENLSRRGPKEVKIPGVTPQKVALKANRLEPPTFQEATAPKFGPLESYTPEQQIALSEKGLAPLQDFKPERTLEPKTNASHMTPEMVDEVYKGAGVPEAQASHTSALERARSTEESPKSVGEEYRAMRGEKFPPHFGEMSKEGKYSPSIAGGAPTEPPEASQEPPPKAPATEFPASAATPPPSPKAKIVKQPRPAEAGGMKPPKKPPTAEAAGPAPEERPRREPEYPKHPSEVGFTKGHVGALRGRRAIHQQMRKNPPPGYQLHEYNDPQEIKDHIESFGEAIFKVKTLKNATAENPHGTERSIRLTTKAPEGFPGWKKPGARGKIKEKHNLIAGFEVDESGNYMKGGKAPGGYQFKEIHTDEPLTIDGPNDARAYAASDKYLRHLESLEHKPLMEGAGGKPTPAPETMPKSREPEAKKPPLPVRMTEGAGGKPTPTMPPVPLPPYEEQPLRGGRKLLDVLGKAAGAPYRLEQRAMGKLEEISGLARKLEGVEGGKEIGRAFRIGGPLAVPGYRTAGLAIRGSALAGAAARKAARIGAPRAERRGFKSPDTRDPQAAVKALIISRKKGKRHAVPFR